MAYMPAEPPLGSTPRVRHAQQEATNASVLLTRLPAPYAEVVSGFTEQNLAARMIDLQSKKDIRIDGQDALLLNFKQRAYGGWFQKWAVVFGDAEATSMVTATFPDQHAETLTAELRKSLLSVVAIEMKAAALPFQVTVAAGLVRVQSAAGMGKMAIYTKNGKIPNESPSDPLMVVGLSMGDIPIEDQKKFAIKRIYQTAHTDIETISSLKQVEIDGLPGHEIVAQATDEDSATELVAYQVILYPPQGGYVLMQGLAGETVGDEYLAKFRKMANSYKAVKP